MHIFQVRKCSNLAMFSTAVSLCGSRDWPDRIGERMRKKTNTGTQDSRDLSVGLYDGEVAAPQQIRFVIYS